ncbi:MAG: hypothetical protein ACYC3I_05695 [Gemmataceae bacterium]
MTKITIVDWEGELTMFTRDDMRTLLGTRPFVPFRLWLSDGGHIDIRSSEQALPLRYYAIVALLDPNAPDDGFDRHATVWYMYVTRHEAMLPGPSPFTAPGEPPSGTPAPASGT